MINSFLTVCLSFIFKYKTECCGKICYSEDICDSCDLGCSFMQDCGIWIVTIWISAVSLVQAPCPAENLGEQISKASSNN